MFIFFSMHCVHIRFSSLFFFSAFVSLIPFPFFPLLSYVPFLLLRCTSSKDWIKEGRLLGQNARLFLYFLDVRCPLRYYTQERGTYMSCFLIHVPRLTFLSFSLPFGPSVPSINDNLFSFSYIYISICITYQGNPYNQASRVYMLCVHVLYIINYRLSPLPLLPLVFDGKTLI